jgi:transposase
MSNQVFVRRYAMQIYIGIDWSESSHDITFLNEAGQIVVHKVISHSQEGFLEIQALRQQLHVEVKDCVVGIETAHSQLVDTLWDWGYQQVYVLPPNAVNKARSLYKSNRVRTDESDSWLVADLIRNDRFKFHPWFPDSELTRQIRASVRLSLTLDQEIHRLSNQLRSVLMRYYPAATTIFSGLDGKVSLDFIKAYPDPRAVCKINYAEFEQFAAKQGYRRRKNLPACYKRLRSDFPDADPTTIQVYQPIALCLVNLLMPMVQQHNDLLRQISQLYKQHPDAEIFSSLPGAGTLLEPALLAKFGDDRRRFPSPAALQALAGTCPVTDASGKRKAIYFRRACDHEFRWIVHQWALCSTRSSDWASTYFEQVRARGHPRPHALRCLANRWLAIAWRLWQDHTTYDESIHLTNRANRSKPKTQNP